MRFTHRLRAVLMPLVANRRRRSLLAVLTATSVGLLAWAAVGVADNASGCDFAATGTTQSCSGPLTGSTFAGGDGNLLASPTTFGSTDWQNVAGRNTGIDLPSGTGDNSFGQGTKEDDPNVSVVTGSIPPQKSDLTRFYEASEFASGSNFLYLAWERTNNLGSANMDFEINQKTQPNLTTTGAKTLNRTAGDLLVTFDFNNGGGRPTLNLLRWLTSATTPSGVPGFPTNVCLSSNSFPCWGDEITLNSTNSIGAVNNLDAVTDPFAPGGTNNVGALRFGETAINLTAAGVFPPGTCEAFGSAFLKSRSSASFPAEVKDFVAPVPVNISNCGDIKILKQTDPRGVNQVFGYTSNLPQNASAGGVTCQGNSGAGIQSDGSFCLNDQGNSGKTLGSTAPAQNSAGNTVDTGPIQAGSYTVTEGANPSGFSFESLTCTGGSTSTSGKTATINLAPNDQVVCLYTNQQLTGAIKITKTSNKAAKTPLAGAKFSIKDPNGNALPGSPFTTDSNGVVCVDGLTPLGNYTVQETGAPTGYAIDDSTAHTVNVTGSNAKCSDASFTGQSLSFTDTPKTDLTITATSQVPGGTQSSIQCTTGDPTGFPGTNIGNSPVDFTDPANVTANGLSPGTYTCKVVIDP
jgi:Prealbumin-like fold domain